MLRDRLPRARLLARPPAAEVQAAALARLRHVAPDAVVGGWVPDLPPAVDGSAPAPDLPAAPARVDHPVRLLAGWRVDPGRPGALALAAVVVVAVLVAVVVLLRARPQPVAVPAALPSSASPSAAASVVVDVAGKVRHPGVLTLPAGSRVVDAVRAAGGALPGVDTGPLNLARRLVDGEQVLVGVTPPPGTGGAAAGRVNLNTATAAQLETLPGVGPVLAARIVEWRDGHGGFRSVSQLQQVPGIGPAKYAELSRPGPGVTRWDVRLALPAGSAWLVAAALLGVRPATCAVVATVTALAAGLAGRARRWALAAALATACGAAAVVALHTTAVDAGPVRVLAAGHDDVDVTLRVTTDPTPRTGHVVGAALRRGGVSLHADVLVVSGSSGPVRVRSPVLVLADPTWASLLPSQRVRAHGRLTPLEAPDLVALLVVHGPPDAVTPPSAVQRVAGAVREGLRRACRVVGGEARGLVPGLVVGDVRDMPPGLVTDFRTAGLSHLTAASGANLAILTATVLAAARRAGLPLLVRPTLGLVAVAVFVVLARPSPSVLRAAVMGTVVAAATAGGRRASPLPALAAAVLALVLWSPSMARSPGFVLSVLATTGLVLLAPRWRDRLARWMPGWAADALAVPAAAHVACTPVLAALSGSVSLVAVVANLLAAPAVAPATVVGMVAALASPVVLPVAQVLAWVAGLPTAWLVWVGHTAAALPGAALPWADGAAGAAAAVAVGLAGWWALRRPAARRAAAAGTSAVVLAVTGVHVLLPGWPPSGWLLAVCDVGQGDAIAVRTAPHAALVVDAGPDPRPVDRCLRDLGVRQVPLVVLSHLHADHVEGLPGVLRHRSVGAVEVGPLLDPPEEYRRVVAYAAAARVPLVRSRLGERRQVGGVGWEVIAPVEVLHGTSSDPNNDSVVLRVRVGPLTVLLTGDVEPPAQQVLLDSGADLHADVLKVPHHGSARQTPAFLDAVGARFAVASVGAGNPYGHPSAANAAPAAGGRGADLPHRPRRRGGVRGP